MTALRVLTVDDEPDIREVVEISLSLDPELIVRTCSSGREAIAVAGDWLPDLVLLDVMMPGMDGPTTLLRLRESPQTRDIPVIFMTARTQSREVEAFLGLGAKAVIAKPFDPLTLASLVRSRMGGKTDGKPIASGVAPTQSDEVETAPALAPAPGVRSVAVAAPEASFDGQRERFLVRARTDEMTLVRDRQALAQDEDQTLALERVQAIAHRLAGGAGICGLDDIGNQAFTLEEAATAQLAGARTTEITTAIDALVNVIDRA